MIDLDFSLVDLLAVPASVHDVHGRFLHMNAGAERASGMTAAEMRGRHVGDLVVPEARANVLAQFNRALGGEAAEFETVFVAKGGEVRGARALHLPLRDGDGVVAVLILAFGVAARWTPETIPAPPSLTRRQLQILQLMAAGHSTEEMASELGLSLDTVRNHLRGLLRVLNAHTRLEAIATGHRLGLLSPPPLEP